MQPENILLSTYRELVTRGLATVDSALVTVPTYAVDDRPDALKTAANTWNVVGPKALAAIDQGVIAFGDAIVANQSNTELTPAAIASRGQTISTQFTDAINAQVTEVLTRIDKVMSMLKAGGFPTRPQPQDAAQEAALAGLKSDLIMVLANTTDGFELVDGLADKLQRAISDGDKVAVWLLASSRWPEDYLTSRQVAEFVPAWSAAVAAELDAGADTGLDDVRDAYRTLDSRDGFKAISQSLTALLPQILADIAGWRLRPRGQQLELRTA